MNKLNILHKLFALAVTALFAVTQAMLIQIQQNIDEALPGWRIKNEVVRQGTGENARVVVTLRNDETVAGFISRVSDDQFTVVNPETSEETTIDYKAVARVDKIDAGVEFIIALLETANAGELLIKAIF